PPHLHCPGHVPPLSLAAPAAPAFFFHPFCFLSHCPALRVSFALLRGARRRLRRGAGNGNQIKKCSIINTALLLLPCLFVSRTLGLEAKPLTQLFCCVFLLTTKIHTGRIGS